ncbi:MAG: RNase III inhibitor, partial [Firmicutes bacterium]|nr:RNase III inhibitor [Bacillota bacterium]
FAIALQLNVEETNDLIGRAGYVLSRSSKADLAVECFIEHQIYNIDRINEVLYAHDLPLLGGTA